MQENISEIVFASTESLVGAIFLDIEQGLDTSSITLGSRSRKTDRGTYLGFIIISISCQELKTKARIINQAIVNQSSKSKTTPPSASLLVEGRVVVVVGGHSGAQLPVRHYAMLQPVMYDDHHNNCRHDYHDDQHHDNIHP